MCVDYFTFQEFIKTETGLFNTPVTISQLANLVGLWDTLNSLREKLDRPIIVNSAFRSPQVNKQVRGAKRSLHMQGRAADIRCEPMYMDELWKIIEQFDRQYGLSEKIRYPTFFHIAI